MTQENETVEQHVLKEVLKALLEQGPVLAKLSVVSETTQTAVDTMNSHLVEFDKAFTKFGYSFQNLQKEFDEQKLQITEHNKELSAQKDKVRKIEDILFGNGEYKGLVSHFDRIKDIAEKLDKEVYGDVSTDRDGIKDDVKLMKKEYDKKQTLWGVAASLWAVGGTGGFVLVIFIVKWVLSLNGIQVPDGG